ncbi:hypothetical protein JYT88_00990 [Rhodospirillaceae bacterium AH-315-P19]|nr:hypothetical protein [Rhodospirillaceae bacterium AH-315-P19]
MRHGMKAYEELVGGEGRLINYRADRHKAQDLFRRTLPDIEIARRPYVLQDLSMSGIAVFANRENGWSGEPGEQVPIHIRLGNTVLHEGRGRICRVEPTPFGTKVALQLTSGYLDIPQLVARHEEICLRRELEGGLNAASEHIPPEYRQLTSDILHLLRRYRSAIKQFNGTANPHTPENESRMAEVLSICEERILPEWRTLWHQANALVEPIMKDPEALKETKRFTELVLTPEFMEAPVWKRAYEKPLGYPGDFEAMNYIYTWRRQGTTPYGKLLHRIGLDTAECIANRMVMMQQIIAEIVANKNGPVHMTNLACGPAQEIINFLRRGFIPHAVHITLIDQDHQALSQAYERIYPETLRLAGQASVNCLHASFGQLLKGTQLLDKIPAQDLIYMVGLVDYLSQRAARALINGLYRQLAPGGCLVVGNVKKSPASLLWPTEFLCDWSLVYRTEAETFDLARDLPASTTTVKTDASDCVQMLYIRKPDA